MSLEEPPIAEVPPEVMEEFLDEVQFAPNGVVESGFMMPLLGGTQEGKNVLYSDKPVSIEALTNAALAHFGVDLSSPIAENSYTVQGLEGEASEGEIIVDTFEIQVDDPDCKDVVLGRRTFANGDVEWNFQPRDFRE